MKPTLKIVSLVEATTMNAVARIVFEFLRTARELTDEVKIEGSVVTFARGAELKATEMQQTFQDAGIEVVTIAERRRFDLKSISALTALFDSAPPDIIVTHSVKSHAVIWRSQLWKKYSWVAFHHGYTSTDSKMLIYNQFDRWSLRRADRVGTVCQAFARQLARKTKIPQERIFVQHNSIRRQPRPTDDEVNELRRKFLIAEGERVLLSVGRLSKEKAHAELLKALKLIAAANPELRWKLLIVGEGPERANLERTARSSGYIDQIIFVGQVANVQPYYALSDVFVLPSHSEGSPNVLLEAMAAEVPVVATAVGGVPEIVVNEESALLVAPKNPQAFGTAILRILQDSALRRRLSTAASALVEREYSAEQYARNLIEIYQEVIERRASRS